MAYTSDTLASLIVTEPNGATEPVANADDAIRQVKRYLHNTLGDPAVSGSVFDAVAAGDLATRVPVATILPYGNMAAVWTAPTGYLKCDGNTIGDVSSGAFYESANYEALFDILKESFGNASTEVFASGDTVKLPLIANWVFPTTGNRKDTEVSATTANGSSLSSTSDNGTIPTDASTVPFESSIVFSGLTASALTTTDELEYLTGVVFDVEVQGRHPFTHTYNSMEAFVSYDAGSTYTLVTQYSRFLETLSTGGIADYDYVNNFFVPIPADATTVNIKFTLKGTTNGTVRNTTATLTRVVGVLKNTVHSIIKY